VKNFMAKLSEYEYAFYIDDQLVMITNVDEIGELMLDVEKHYIPSRPGETARCEVTPIKS
jgi:hypothetical protein